MIRLDVRTNLYSFVLALVFSAYGFGASITSVGTTEEPVHRFEALPQQEEMGASVWTDPELGKGAVVNLVVDGPSLLGLDIDFSGAGVSRQSAEGIQILDNGIGDGASRITSTKDDEVDLPLTSSPALALAGGGAVVGSGFLGVVLLIRRKKV